MMVLDGQQLIADRHAASDAATQHGALLIPGSARAWNQWVAFPETTRNEAAVYTKLTELHSVRGDKVKSQLDGRWRFPMRTTADAEAFKDGRHDRYEARVSEPSGRQAHRDSVNESSRKPEAVERRAQYDHDRLFNPATRDHRLAVMATSEQKCKDTRAQYQLDRASNPDALVQIRSSHVAAYHRNKDSHNDKINESSRQSWDRSRQHLKDASAAAAYALGPAQERKRKRRRTQRLRRLHESLRAPKPARRRCAVETRMTTTTRRQSGLTIRSPAAQAINRVWSKPSRSLPDAEEHQHQ